MAARGWVRLQIRAQPFFLRRAGLAPTYLGALTIEDDNVPRAEVITVIALLWITGIRAKIIKIGSSAAGVKLVVTGCRTSASFLSPPGRVVALGELLGGAGVIGVVTRGENGARNGIEQFGRGFRARKVCTVGDITGTYENWV